MGVYLPIQNEIPMKTICIDCRYIGPRPSGISKVQSALVDFLPGLAPDIEFVFLKRDNAPSRLSKAANVREIVVQAAANSPATMWWLPRMAAFGDADLFHATFNIMPRGLAMPCVTTIHDVMWLANPDLCKPRFYAPLERWFYGHGIRRALREARAIATVSEASRQEILHMQPGLASRVQALALGVDDAFKPGPAASAAYLAGLGIPEGKRIVLTVGQYVPYKNHEGALRIFAEAFAGQGDVVLIFVQRLTPNMQVLRALAGELGIADQVHFLDAVDDQALVALYRAAAALLHPSFCEGFGLPLVEAMACGCPVVASDQSAMPEVLGGAGLLAPVKDTQAMARALRQVVDNPDVAERLRHLGLARAATFSWARFAEGNLALYRDVLQC